MIKTTALILERSDFTREANLKKEAFDAMCMASVVVYGSVVVKNRETGDVGGVLAAPKPAKIEITEPNAD